MKTPIPSGWRFDFRNIKSSVSAAALCAATVLVFSYFIQLPTFTFISTFIVLLFAVLNWQDGPRRSWVGLVVAILAGVVLWLHLFDPLRPLLYGLIFGAPSWILKALWAKTSPSEHLRHVHEGLHDINVPNSAKCSVVFVHGVHGDYLTTWSIDGTDANYWPSWVAQDFSEAAVYSLQYDAYVTDWLGTTMPLYDRAVNVLDILENDSVFRRPTVLIVHSFGGLVAKKMWQIANERGRTEVLQNLRTIIFIATPHSGSRLGAFMKFILSRAVTRTTVTADELGFGEPQLRELNIWYRHNSVSRNFVYYETQPTDPFGIVVDAVSADLAVPNVYPVAINADHLTICKPANRETHIAKSVRKNLQELLSDTGSLQPILPLPPGIQPSPEELYRQIQSGNADIVRDLLMLRVDANTRLNGQTPLRAALEQIDSPDRIIPERHEAVAVLKALIEVGKPRDLAAEAHTALEHNHFGWLIALRHAGVPVDIRDASGRSLLLKAIRHIDSFAPRNQLPDWFEPFLFSGLLPEPPLAVWLLLWSCRRALPRIVPLLLAKGVPPDARIDSVLPQEELTKDDLTYWTPGGTGLHMAASSPAPSAQILQLLLSKGADPAALDRNGDTPLVLAIRQRRSEIIEPLLASTCSGDAGSANLSRQPVLINAVGDEHLLRRLVTAGAAPGSSDAVAALHHASYEFDWRSLTALLDAGVPVDSRDEYGRTPLIKLFIFDIYSDWRKPDRLRCCKLLLDRGADVDACDSDGDTALHHVAMLGEPSDVAALLAKNPNVNAVNHNGQTPLMRAESVQNAELLLQHGADPNAQDRCGFSPLAYAILYREDEIAAVLTTAGANQDGLDRTHLLAAIKEQDHECLKQYLHAGVDPNTCNPWGRTALYVAADLWDANAVKILLEAGADANARSNGRTPLWAALIPSVDIQSLEKLADTVDALLNAGASLDDLDSQGNSAAHTPSSLWWSEHRLAARLLLVCAAKVNGRGETLLMHVAELGRLDQLRQLMNTGIDINAADAQGRTALFRAISFPKDRVERARLLLDHGALVNAADHAGQTPLIRAAIANYTDLIRLLIQYRADLHHLDNVGKTARYHALTSGKLEAHNLLLSLEHAASAAT